MLDIDDIYKKVIQKMTDGGTILEMSLKLAKIGTKGGKVAYITEILNENEMMPKFFSQQKSVLNSKAHRNKGNAYFKARRDYDAVLCYSKAILSAPLDSEEIALAYGNRSAALFSLKNFEGSRRDIERAFSLNFPTDATEKLQKRLEACEQFLSSSNRALDRIEALCRSKFAIAQKRHDLIPCAISKIDLKHTPDLGRHVVTTVPIAPGEVIALEKPYVTILQKAYYLNRCYNCLEQCDYLVPCHGCCEVMYCDDKCRDENSYHRYECPIMTLLMKLNFTKLELFSLRIVLKALNDYGDWGRLSDAVARIDDTNDQLHHGFVDGIFDSKNYPAIHSLATNFDKRDHSDIFQKGVTAAVLLHLLDNHTELFNSTKNPSDAKDFIGGLLFHHGMTVPTNMHSISKTYCSRNGDCCQAHNLGSGAYAFLSMLNHSCASNVVRYTIGTTMVLVALRPICAGGQVFDNYRYHPSIHTLQERVLSLRHQYKFVCKCEACIANWPLYGNLPRARRLTAKQKKLMARSHLDAEMLEALKKGDREVALEHFHNIGECLAVLDDRGPCLELADYQETYKQCWALFEGVVPFHESEMFNPETLE